MAQRQSGMAGDGRVGQARRVFSWCRRREKNDERRRSSSANLTALLSRAPLPLTRLCPHIPFPLAPPSSSPITSNHPSNPCIITGMLCDCAPTHTPLLPPKNKERNQTPTRTPPRHPPSLPFFEGFPAARQPWTLGRSPARRARACACACPCGAGSQNADDDEARTTKRGVGVGVGGGGSVGKNAPPPKKESRDERAGP
jgi:hypothetical protein